MRRDHVSVRSRSDSAGAVRGLRGREIGQLPLDVLADQELLGDRDGEPGDGGDLEEPTHRDADAQLDPEFPGTLGSRFQSAGPPA